MKISKWLIINEKGACRITTGKPSLNYDEVAMKLNIEIPDSVFIRPHLQANIKIDGELQHEFNYEEEKNIKDVLETLPNIHLLSISVDSSEKS